MAYTPEQIRNAWEDSLAQGYTPEQIYQGALANFGVTKAQVDSALAKTVGVNVQQMFENPLTPQQQLQVAQRQLEDMRTRLQEGDSIDPESWLEASRRVAVLSGGRPIPRPGMFSEDELGLLEEEAFNPPIITPLPVAPTVSTPTAQQPQTVIPSQPAQTFSGLFSSGNTLADKAQQVLENSGKANDARYADTTVGSFTQNGVIYNVQGDGSIQGIIETPTGAYVSAGFTPEGKQATEQLSTKFEQTDVDRALGLLANAAIAAGTGFALGPAGIGALSAPAAAAAGAGVTNFANTADLQQALKAAALAGGSAVGLGQLFPSGAAANTDAAFIAADAAQLASQGIGEAQISTILQASGVAPSIAANVAASAAEGLTPSQIIQDIGNIQFAGTTTTPAVTVTSPEQVVVTGKNVGLGALSDIAPALSAIVPSITLPQVEVTGQTFQPETTKVTVPETISTVIPAVVGGTTQQVGVEGKKVTPQPTETAASTVGAIIPGITAAIPTAAEQVQVTSKKIPETSEIVPSTVSAALPVLSPTITQPLPKAIEPTVKSEESLFKPSDILKLLTLISGTAAAGGAAQTAMPVSGIPPSDTMLGSTTPQFGNDYYAAVQRYYNAFMPETPRNVAGPLQQWYENKYGA